MIARVLEPEVMDTAEDAADYDAMDHSAVNRAFVADFLSTHPAVSSVLDVGTGTALIPIELCRQSDSIRVVGVDLSQAMLDVAQRNIVAAGFEDRIGLTLMDASGLYYHPGAFSAVVSNSIVHHIPQPLGCLTSIILVCRPGGRIFVRDLFRPDSEAELDRLVNLHAAGANDHQRQLFADSLRAALTLDEVRGMVGQLGFAPETVTQTSDRHWTWSAVCP
ncbi:class I SAM-dependent methyltransferase [soil metagenome]